MTIPHCLDYGNLMVVFFIFFLKSGSESPSTLFFFFKNVFVSLGPFGISLYISGRGEASWDFSKDWVKSIDLFAIYTNLLIYLTVFGFLIHQHGMSLYLLRSSLIFQQCFIQSLTFLLLHWLLNISYLWCYRVWNPFLKFPLQIVHY